MRVATLLIAGAWATGASTAPSSWAERSAYAAAQVMSWYEPNSGRFGGPGDWQAANAMDAMAKHAGLLSGKNRSSLLSVLRSAFEKTVTSAPVPDSTPDNWGQCHDDVMWGAFGWMRLYASDSDATNRSRYISRAAMYYDWVVSQEVDWIRLGQDSCPSRPPNVTKPTPEAIAGVHSCRYNPKAFSGKNTVTNSQFIQLALRLLPHAAELGKSAGYYRGLADRGWAWLNASGLQSTGVLFNDAVDMDTCKNSGDVTFSYNQGLILPALAAFANLTGDQRYLEPAFKTLDAVVRYMSYNGSVLHEAEGSENGTESEGCDQFWGGPCRRWAIFKGIFVRNLADFLVSVAADPRARRFANFIRTSAESAWANSHCSRVDSTNPHFAYDWSGTRKDIPQSCNESTYLTNVMAQDVAALDLFNAAQQLQSEGLIL